MSDIDRVFARLGGKHPAGGDQHELRRIPRKGGSTAGRVVQVVRLPASSPAASGSNPRRTDFRVRAETWDDGFPAKAAPPPSPSPQPIATQAPEPIAHVMPMWEPVTDEVASAPPVPGSVEDQLGQPTARASTSKARRPSRRVADPFDAADDGANCLRCGYVIEPARERRGLMTCAECG